MNPNPQNETLSEKAKRLGFREMPEWMQRENIEQITRPGHYALSVHDGVTQWVPLKREPEPGGWLLGAGIALAIVAALVGAVACALEAMKVPK